MACPGQRSTAMDVALGGGGGDILFYRESSMSWEISNLKYIDNAKLNKYNFFPVIFKLGEKDSKIWLYDSDIFVNFFCEHR